MSDLHLNLKGEYFDEIVAGTKKFEYQLKNDYWTKRLVGRSYGRIHFKKGYPKADDLSKIHTVPYRGYECRLLHILILEVNRLKCLLSILMIV